MSKFSEKLSSLGFGSYADYLKSPIWIGFRERYRSSGLSMRCKVCGHNRIQLHHHTYERLGNERLDDVTPLCRNHHEAVHEWLKTSGKQWVEFTHLAIASLRGESKPIHPKKKARKAQQIRDYELRELRWKTDPAILEFRPELDSLFVKGFIHPATIESLKRKFSKRRARRLIERAKAKENKQKSTFQTHAKEVKDQRKKPKSPPKPKVHTVQATELYEKLIGLPLTKKQRKKVEHAYTNNNVQALYCHLRRLQIDGDSKPRPKVGKWADPLQAIRMLANGHQMPPMRKVVQPRPGTP